MSKLGWGGAVVAILTAVPLGIGVVQEANTPKTDTQLVRPAVTTEAGSFYTDAQIDDVWRAVTKDYPEPLPPGVTFPTRAPAIFHPDDGKSHGFQSGLPDMIAAQYWQCAWLKASLTSSKSGDRAASTRSPAQLDSDYSKLPSVARHVNIHDYLGKVSAFAKRSGLSRTAAEFELQCEGF